MDRQDGTLGLAGVLVTAAARDVGRLWDAETVRRGGGGTQDAVGLAEPGRQLALLPPTHSVRPGSRPPASPSPPAAVFRGTSREGEARHVGDAMPGARPQAAPDAGALTPLQPGAGLGGGPPAPSTPTSAWEKGSEGPSLGCTEQRPCKAPGTWAASLANVSSTSPGTEWYHHRWRPKDKGHACCPAE